MSDKLLVELAPSHLEVEPGAAPAETVVTVQNLGSEVDQYNVEVLGLDPEWFTAPLAAVGLFPQDREQVQISFHPPKRPGLRAGVYTFNVRVRSRGGVEEQSVKGMLDVRGYAVFRLDLTPRRQSGRGRGNFRAELNNTGTADVQVELSARDDEEACRFRFTKDDAPMVPANSKIEAPFVIEPKERPWVGPERSYDFTLTATPKDARGDPQTATGQFTHRPYLPSWGPIVRAAWKTLIVLGLLLLAVVLFKTGTTGEFLRRLQVVKEEVCQSGLRQVPVLNSICPTLATLPVLPTPAPRPSPSAAPTISTTTQAPAEPAWSLVAGSQGAAPGQFNHPYGIALDSQGNIYVADTNNNRVQKLSPRGQPQAQWGTEGSGPGQFKHPFGIALDTQGNVYVADTNNHRIQKLSSNGQPLAQWGSQGNAAGQFATPTGLWLNKQGEIFVAEYVNNRIQKLSPSGQPLAQWGGPGNAPGKFKGAADVVLDGQGNLYVADQDNHRIQKLSPSGQPLAQWGTHGSAPGQFDRPAGVAVDGEGNIYVADYGNNRIQRLSPNGQPLAQWGPQGSGPGQFNAPSALVVDGQGSILVADTNNDRVQRYFQRGR